MRRGEVIPSLERCQSEGVNLERGMNYRLHGTLLLPPSFSSGKPVWLVVWVYGGAHGYLTRKRGVRLITGEDSLPEIGSS